MKPAAPVMTTRFFMAELMLTTSSRHACGRTLDEREPHDLQIEAHRPVLDVVQVVLDALLERRVAAPAVHLRPAGDAGLHLVAQHVLRDLVLELRDEMRPLRARPDDRHVAAQHVPELRQLVDVRAAQELAERRHAADRRSLRPHRPGLALGVVVHRAELDDRERLAVEAHPLLAVEDGAARRELDERRDEPERNRQHDQRRRSRSRCRSPRLTMLLKPCSGTSLMLMTGTPSRSSSRARSAITCSRSGTTLTSTHLAAGALDELEHLHVLLGRQRDVEVIDRLARRDLGRFVDRAEQRQAAVAEVIARRPVVDEADDLIAELAVLEDLVGDQAAQLAGAGDQDPLEADAGAPAALEHLAHQLARREGQRDVEHQEDRPDRLRHLERAALAAPRRSRSRSARTASRRCRRRRRGCCRRTRRRSRRRASGRGAGGRGPAAGSRAARARR